MGRVYGVAVTLAVFGVMAHGSAAMADHAPAPVQTPSPACSSPEQTIAPDATKQATVVTVGLISDRIAATVSGYNSGSTSGLSSGTAPIGNLAAPAATGCGLPQQQQQAPPPVLTLTGDGQAVAVPQNSTHRNGAWVGGSNSWLSKNDPNANFKGQVINGVAGYDFKVRQDTIVGVAVGYENYNFDTLYNAGTLRGKSVSVAPYVGYAVTDWLALDATIGHGWVYYDYTRSADAIDGKTDASRWFGSADLTTTHHLGDTTLHGSFGFLKIYEAQKGFTESNGAVNDDNQVNLAELRAGVAGAYAIQTPWGTVSPNASARLEYDLAAPHSVQFTTVDNAVTTNGATSSNRIGATLGLGVEATTASGWKLGVAGTTEELRRNTNVRTLMGNARYSF